jgi:perosamine synthetase
MQDYIRIKEIAKKYNLKIINDCAGSFLTLCKNNDLLNFSDITICSFNGNKCPSSGMGGSVITNNKKYFDYSKNFSANFQTKKKYLHSDYGLNIRITNVHAALLYLELQSVYKLTKKKLQITKYYKIYLKKNEKFKFQLPSSIKEVLWINKLNCNKISDAKKIINFLRKKNILTDNFWITMDQQPFLKKIIFEKKFQNNSEIYSKKIVPLPSSTFLQKKNIIIIANLINKFFKN